jgi:diacylglycerol kinase (ATP)
MKNAIIIYNPFSRNPPQRQRLLDAAASVASQGWQVDLRVSEAPGHAIELAREAAAAETSVVFACGGDGTINEVVNGVVGSNTALAVIRGGMGNVFAKEVGISRRPEQALRVLFEGERRRADVGMAGERYFLLMAGIGFDAGVVKNVPSGPKRTLGSTSYAIWGLAHVARYRPQRVLLRYDGEEVETDLYWLLLGNSRSYGGILNITGSARMDDGQLDSYLFAGHSAGWVATMALRLALRRQDGDRNVSFRRLRELEVISAGLPVQADGEYFGETPMRFSVVPSALDVMFPKGRGQELFSAQ